MTVSAIVVNLDGLSVFDGPQIPDVEKHYHGKRMLEACLESLRGLDEVIVADNASRDGSPDFVEKAFPAYRLIRNPDNRGFAPAVCQAAAVAKSDHLLLVNSDVLIDAPRVAKLVEEMGKRPKLGALSCRTEYPGGLLQRPAMRFLTPSLALGQLMGLGSLAAFHPLDLGFDASKYGEPDWVAGGVMLIRREAWDAVGGMDPGFVFYEEDADFCLRLRKAGWAVGYTPEVTAMHVRAASAGRDLAFSLLNRYRSLMRYADKHFAWPGRLAVRLAISARMPFRALLALFRGERCMIGTALNLAWEALRGYLSRDQSYFWTPEWQSGEKEAEEDIAKGRIHGPYKSVADLKKSIKRP